VPLRPHVLPLLVAVALIVQVDVPAIAVAAREVALVVVEAAEAVVIAVRVWMCRLKLTTKKRILKSPVLHV